jgi:hypothetical protein
MRARLMHVDWVTKVPLRTCATLVAWAGATGRLTGLSCYSWKSRSCRLPLAWSFLFFFRQLLSRYYLRGYPYNLRNVHGSASGDMGRKLRLLSKYVCQVNCDSKWFAKKKEINFSKWLDAYIDIRVTLASTGCTTHDVRIYMVGGLLELLWDHTCTS